MNFPGKQNLRVQPGYCFKFHEALNVTIITGLIHVLFDAQVNYLPSSPRLPIQHFVDPIAPTLSLPTPVNPSFSRL